MTESETGLDFLASTMKACGIDMNENIKAGADIHAGDGGYSIGTQENYEAFVKVRNKSLAQARIKELAKQSGLWFVTQREDLINDFAELIVEEIYDFIMEEVGNDNGIPNLGKVKEHFGVDDGQKEN